MADVRGGLRRGITACLLVGSVICAFYGTAVLFTAVTDKSTTGSVLLVGFAFILLVISAMALVIVIMRWTPKNRDESQ